MSQPLMDIIILLGNEYEDWLHQLPLVDEYTDPDYCHQN